jgi:PAS domain S-box-containing protein
MIASDAIICTDERQNITFFNAGAEATFGYAALEVLGQPLSALLPPRVRAAHEGHVSAFARSTTPSRTMGERREITGLRKDGSEFPAEAAIAHVATPEGSAYSVVLRDITERRKIEMVNARLVRDLQAAVAARDEMLGVVSHDLRNPVNAVKMLSTAILSVRGAGDLSEEVRSHASTMRQAAEQMDTLIQDLLDVTRLESGRLRLSPHPVALQELVDAVFATLGPLAVEAGVALVSDVSDPSLRVDADRNRVLQVLSNVVGNAIKYTPRGGDVTISGSRDAGTGDVRVAVVDSGVGIDSDELPRVFDRFWQSKRKNRSGAGLGLSIARGLVRAHGGRIWIESELDRGTCVYFTLPAA